MDDFNYNYIDEERIGFKEYVQSLVAFTEYWEERLKKSDEPALRAYIRAVIDSFVNRLEADDYCSKCQHCGKIIKFKAKKKYCSLKEEGQDCDALPETRGITKEERTNLLKNNQRKIKSVY